MVQTYTETTKDNILYIELLAHLDNGWNISEIDNIVINTESFQKEFQKEKQIRIAKMYDRFNETIQQYILKPQTEGTLPPTEDNAKPKILKNVDTKL